MTGSEQQQTFLVTGGTGSLGTALTLHLLAQGHKVRVFARNEHSHQKLEQSIPQEQRPRFSSLLGAVEDLERLRMAMRGVDCCIHAAAQKAIPLAEYNPGSCVRTNVDGTANVLTACLEAGVKRAVLVSSDKARAPSTLYGATKLCAERLWLAANRYSAGKGTEFMAVAYGNVWGSQGSVLQAFQKQMQYGHLEITDPKMTRFHITLPQAVEFVLAACEDAAAGTLWIPKLPSYKLGDLAAAFQAVTADRVEWKDPVITGRRPAEKLHEELISENESHSCREEGKAAYILEPGKVHCEGGWSYHSGRNPWFLSRHELEREVSAWLY